jgi:hypothetical protein
MSRALVTAITASVCLPLWDNVGVLWLHHCLRPHPRGFDSSQVQNTHGLPPSFVNMPPRLFCERGDKLEEQIL